MMQQLLTLLLKSRWWFISATIVLGILGIATYRLWCYPFRTTEAVPGTTAAVFSFPVDKAKDSTSDSVKTAPFFHAFPELQQDYTTFQSFFQRAGGAIPGDAEWMVQNLGSGQLALSLAVDAPSFPLEEALAPYQREFTVFRGEPIWRLSSPEGTMLALSRYRNLLLLGRLPLQVEASITELKEGVSEWAPPAPGSPLHLYLRADNLSGLGAGIWAPPLRDALRQFEQFCDGLNLSFEKRGDTLDIRGTLESRGGISHSPSGEISDGGLLNYLPDNLAWCFRKPLDTFSRGEGAGLEPYLASWVGAELAYGSMALPGKEEDNQFLLIAIRPETDANSQLDTLARELGILESYNFQSFHIIRLRADSLLVPLGAGMANPYFTILGDYVGFSNSKVVLEQLARSLLAGKALVQEEPFLKLWASLKPRRNTFWAYTNTDFLRLRLPAYLEQQQEPVSRFIGSFEAMMVAVEPDGSISGRILPKSDGAQKPASGMAWVVNLDTTAASGVQYLPGEGRGQGVLIQDAAYGLYLISERGERLWKIRLEEPVIGSISCLPSRRYGRQRIAFATPGKVCMLTDQGRPVANFPLKLPAPASSPLLAVDFEGQQRYHLFVACENGKIYGFDHRGVPLAGWSPQEQLDSLVRQPMAHFQKDNKDYLLALSEAGTLHVFGRDGALRFDPVKTGAAFRSPPFFQAEGAFERIAMGDERGLGHIVNLQGDYFRLKLMPGLEEGTRFLFVNLAGDERKDYLAYRGTALVSRYYEGLKFVTHFSETLDMPVDTAFILPFAGREHIGLLHREDRKISLLDETGALLPGFPLAGDVPFSLAPLPEGGQVIFTGYGASIYAYRLY